MRIVTGLAASGKTSMLLREIAEKAEANRGRQILLVPELNSHQMERRLAAATHNHGARTAEVLTFSRLADRVFAVVGGLAQQMRTPEGQLLTLQEAARRVQVGLTAWSGLADKPELLSETLALIDECKSCMIEPETLFRASEESALDEDAALSAKLRDLAQILTQYDSLCGETLPDPRDRLTHLRDGLAESHVLDGAEIYLDGFLSYTPQELAIIEVMLSSGVPLTAAVTCDVELPDVFVTGCRTLRTLTRMAERCSRRPELVDLGTGKMPRPAGLAAVANEALLPVRQAHEDASGGQACNVLPSGLELFLGLLKRAAHPDGRGRGTLARHALCLLCTAVSRQLHLIIARLLNGRCRPLCGLLRLPERSVLLTQLGKLGAKLRKLLLLPLTMTLLHVRMD